MSDPVRQQAGRHFRAPRTRPLPVLWGALAVVIIALVVVALVRPQSLPPLLEAPLPAAVPSTPVAAAPKSLDDDIAAILKEAGNYRVGVAMADIAGDGARTFGDESTFVAGSTAKIITAAAFYHLVEVGEANLDESLGAYDAAFQLKAMVNDSNNDSWLLLMDAIGYPRLIDYAASIGIVYDPEENLLTPADMALVLKQLYAGDLLDRDHTAQLLGYMQDTNNETLIPAGSRPGITVHHKYGQVDGDLHDAALLSYRESTFALVIYTEEDTADTEDSNEADQVDLIHALTRAIEDALFAPDA